MKTSLHKDKMSDTDGKVADKRGIAGGDDPELWNKYRIEKYIDNHAHRRGNRHVNILSEKQLDEVFRALLNDNPDLIFLGRKCRLTSELWNNYISFDYII